MAHPGGRPREYDRSYIKKRLLAWAQQPNALNISSFCCLPDIHMSVEKLLTFCYDEPEFREVYNEAKAFIASNREEANACKELSDAAYNKHLHVYDHAYKHANRDEKLFDVELAKDLKKYEKNLDGDKSQSVQEIEKQFDNVLDQLKSMSRSKRNID